jgi:hypothetical protein
MAEQTAIWVVLSVIVGLVVGGLFGAIGFSDTVEVEVPGETQTIIECADGSFVDDSTNCPDIVIPNETTEIEVEVEVPIDAESLYLMPAIDEVFDELDDEDDFLTCKDFEYDEDEIEVTTVKEWSYTWHDDDEYTVEFTAKFKFDEEDERSCRETRTYSVFYEDNEDPEVELID